MTPPSNTRARLIQVQSSIQISPNMQRIFFSSADFTDFPTDQGGAHIKLFFPQKDQTMPLLPFRNEQGKIVWPQGQRPITRTYTIRDFVPENRLLVVDFVRHQDFGIAANWAVHAKPGDFLGLAGPGGPNRYNAQANYFIFMGDLSALPMIAASLKQLSATAKGQVWIDIEHQEDQQPLETPSGFEIFWLSTQQDIQTQIIDSLAKLDWQNQIISVTLAGENNKVVTLRKILRHQYQIDKHNLYAVPYWRHGYSEEHYHDERHRIMDEQE